MKPLLAICHLLMFVVVYSNFVLAQTSITFSISQPDSPFLVNAGEDQIFLGDDIILGGDPTASGGFESYTFSWEPSELLDNPSSANPTVVDISGPITFTLICTDVQGNCIKEDEVFVDYQLSTSAFSEYNVKIYPNPFNELVQIESDLRIQQLTVFDITGKTLSQLNDIPSAYLWNTSELNAGIYLIQIQLENGQTLNQKLCKRD